VATGGGRRGPAGGPKAAGPGLVLTKQQQHELPGISGLPTCVGRAGSSSQRKSQAKRGRCWQEEAMPVY